MINPALELSGSLVLERTSRLRPLELLVLSFWTLFGSEMYHVSKQIRDAHKGNHHDTSTQTATLMMPGQC